MLTWLQRLSARNKLEEQLFPRLKLPVVFRGYAPKDRESCLRIYDENQPGRFPATDRNVFSDYLQGSEKCLIVAESESEVIGFSGITLHGENVATLCYGILSPRVQRQRIGATLTLLRISLIPPSSEGDLEMIHAVDQSLPIYRRFGFEQTGRWESSDLTEHPSAGLYIPPFTHDRIRITLRKRGTTIVNAPVLKPTGDPLCRLAAADGGFEIVEYAHP